MENWSNHWVCLIDKLGESLFFVDGLEDHLVLTLFSYVFNVGSIDILAISHRRDLDTSISDTFSGNEFLIKFWLSLRFDCWFHERFVLPYFTINVKVLGFYDMVLLSFQNFLLFKLFQIGFFLKIERWLNFSGLLDTTVKFGMFGDTGEFLWFFHWTLFEVIFWFESDDWVIFVLVLLLVVETASGTLLRVAFEHASVFVGILLGSCDSLRHSH